jgi:Outer membrane protein beta-barrel domain
MSRQAWMSLARRLGVVGVVGIAGSMFVVASAADAAEITGRKMIGGSVGTSLMIGDWEYRTHARPRLTGDAMFKYGLRPRWAVVGTFGYGWNSYTDEELWLSSEDFADVRVEQGLGPEPVEKVAVVAPFTVGGEYRFGQDAWVPYVGAGFGVYQLNLYFDGRVAEDPRTLADHRTYNFGLYGRAGIEQFLSESVSLDYEALLHVLFAEEREKFPLPNGADLSKYGDDFHAYGGDAQFVQIRLGLRYYWGGKAAASEGDVEPGAPAPEGEAVPPPVTPEGAVPVAPDTTAPAITPGTPPPAEPGTPPSEPQTTPPATDLPPPPPPPAPPSGEPPTGEPTPGEPPKQ